MDSLPQYIFWKDANSRFLGCNDNFAKLLQLDDKAELVGKTDYDMPWSKEQSDKYVEDDKRIIESQQPKLFYEETQLQSGGREVTVLVSKTPFYKNKNDEHPDGIICIYQDISKIKKTESQLKRAKIKAEVASRSKSLFLQNISHDLRTPLTGMIGMARILKKEVVSEKGREAADNLMRASGILLDLLNEVIDVTRIDSKTLPLVFRPINLRKTIMDIAALMQASLEEKRLAFHLHYAKNLPDYFISDQTRLYRILLNLIGNAVKFTYAGQIDITVDVKQKNETDVELKIMMTDTGIGIPPDKQQHVFSRFGRVSASHENSQNGLGLGLSIVKDFMQDLGGEIKLESQLGEGSTFTLFIPAKNADLIELGEPESNEKSFARQANFLNVKILLVEDDVIALSAAKSHLEEFNCDVDTAINSKEALERYKKNTYDLVLMDVGLPDKNGFESTKLIREYENSQQKAATPIFALTAHIDSQNKKSCLDAGMDDVLIKPLVDESIMCILRNQNNKLQHDRKNSVDKEPKEDMSSILSIDLKMGAKLAGGDAIAAKDMLMLLIGLLPEAKLEIEKAYSLRDFASLKSHVHKLHGSSCYCGVPKLKELLHKLELALEKNDLRQLDALLYSLHGEIDVLIKHAKAWG